MASTRREGGRLEIICGDLFDDSIARGPFDIIVSERALQAFTNQDIALAAAALDRRLSPTGQALVRVHNWPDRLAVVRQAFVDLGYDDGTPERAGRPKQFHGSLSTG